MAILEILKAPHPVLSKKATKVKEVTAEIKQLLNDMLETMYAAPGVGLAAPQIGVSKRIIVVDVADTNNGEEPKPYKLINPEIIELSEDIAVCEEGCLSVPESYEEVERPATCIIKALDENGKEVTVKADGLLSVCLQHEIDHLDGILFVDHLSKLKRNMILKKMQKLKKQGRL